MGARFNNNLFVYTPHNLENIFQAFHLMLSYQKSQNNIIQ